MNSDMNAVSHDDSDVLWIDSQQRLQEALGGLDSGIVALDTEFVRTNTFYPRAGVIQLCYDDHVLLIDPQKIEDWSPLNRLFADTSVLKVVHACSEDLELFYSLNIEQPQPLFDTQVASALLGEQLNTGLQKLALKMLDLSLPKHETRSDWTRRPLSEEQLRYARQDVLILLPLWHQLQQRLQDQGKAEIVLKEGELLVSQAANPVRDELVYLKLRGAWKLRPLAQVLLSRLAAWREQTARSENRPRRFICSDDDLVQIAQQRPVSMAQITQCCELQGSSLRRYGKHLISLVRQYGHQVSVPDEFETIRPPLPRDAKELYQMIKEKAHEVAKDRQIQPTLLASRTMLEALLHWFLQGQQVSTPQLMAGWRREWVGEALVELIKQQTQNSELLQQSSL